MDVRNAFTAHPASVNETYWQHLGTAFGFGLRMVAGGLACLVHGLLPFLFTRTGSGTIAALHERMVTHRVVRPGRAGGAARPAAAALRAPDA